MGSRKHEEEKLGLIRAPKAAQILGITPECLRRKIKAGKLNAKRQGGIWLIHESQLIPAHEAPQWESISVKEAADMLGVGTESIARICRDGWVDCYRVNCRKLWRVRKAHIAYGLKLMAQHGFTKIPWYKLRERIAQDKEFQILHKMEDPKIELQRSGPDAGTGRKAIAGVARAMRSPDAADRGSDGRQPSAAVYVSTANVHNQKTQRDHGPGAGNSGQGAGGGNMSRFQSILKIAESKAVEQEAKAAAVKRKRAYELQEMARMADLKLDRRRGRKMGQAARAFVNVNPEELMNALREWRAAHGLSQSEASFRLGVEKGTYQRHELKGINFVDPDYFQRLKKWGVQIEPIGENEQ